jgi:hypothetical protein
MPNFFVKDSIVRESWFHGGALGTEEPIPYFAGGRPLRNEMLMPIEGENTFVPLIGVFAIFEMTLNVTSVSPSSSIRQNTTVAHDFSKGQSMLPIRTRSSKYYSTPKRH